METTAARIPVDAARSLPARNAAIDVLRGLSILLVVLHHIGLRIPLKATAAAALLPRRMMSALNFNGYEAVFVFFVISGFLIAAHSIDRWGSLARIDVRAFYGRRAARILPCLVLVVAVLSLLHWAGATDYRIAREGQSLGRAIVAVAGLHLNWYEGVTGYLPGGWDVLWSLSIEEVFYLGFPLVCLLVRSERVLFLALLALALTLPATRAAIVDNEIWQEKAYLPGMAAIATGILAAILAARVKAPPVALTRALAIVGAVGVGCVLFAGGELWTMLGNGSMLVLTFSTAAMLFAFATDVHASGRRVPGSAWLQSFGRLSYEIYLGHMFVVFAVVAAYRALGANAAWGVAWYVPGVLGSWALGAIVARAFSLPAERGLRRAFARGPVHPAAAVVDAA